MLKYLSVLLVGLSSSMEYRGPFLWNTVASVIVPPAVQIFLWMAVYESQGAKELQGFSLESMMLYLFFAAVCGTLTKSGKAERAIPGEIRTGDLNKYLLKPINHALYSFAASLAERIATYLILVVALSIAATFAFLFFDFTVSLVALGSGMLMLTLAIILRFVMSLMIAYIAFWMDEIWTIFVVTDICLWFLSGLVMPLDMLPSWGRDLSYWAPFQFLAYVPAGYFTGSFQSESLLLHAGQVVGWIAIMGFGASLLWWRGLKRYSAFGG